VIRAAAAQCDRGFVLDLAVGNQVLIGRQVLSSPRDRAKLRFAPTARGELAIPEGGRS
jgi:hypothetical protein